MLEESTWCGKSPPLITRMADQMQPTVYSKLSIIRPGRSRLLELEKKDGTGCLIETFFKNPD